ncbi:hypothetical protein BFO_0072 [Tannerella forsythia 92A2]|uniref:Uncharacterized protein n=1 Tax=Tannerella forsythia (strain ATCC 43037 / JCM 10827 / CCUG 21028 A / KCTC 5666 / FDC 338) TaxID=203275 RepID=G8UHJ4_TANFA|nr:hypothetical protein BFO_0072 [Tannerella forsythia 92A2]
MVLVFLEQIYYFFLKYIKNDDTENAKLGYSLHVFNNYKLYI